MGYIVNREGYGDVVVADTVTGATIGAPAMPPYIAETLSFARNGASLLLYAATGPTFPKVIWAYDLVSPIARRGSFRRPVSTASPPVRSSSRAGRARPAFVRTVCRCPRGTSGRSRTREN